MTLPPKPLAPYETMALPAVSEAQLAEIVRRHNLELDGPIDRLVSSGVVHSLWALGSRWVLRVPKDEAMCLGDHRCEAVAIPLARSVGLRTPELVVFDESCSILPVPYTIVGRIDGENLVGQPFDHGAYGDVGRELALLHTADVASRAHPWLRDTTEGSAEDHFDEVVAAGLIHNDGIGWLRSLCQRLDTTIACGPQPPPAFVHGDVKPDNVMIDTAGTVYLIDWGDAGFADPAHDFQSLPMRSVEQALAGYREERALDPTLEARIVRRIVARSLANLRRTPRRGPSWYRPTAATITDLLTFAVDNPDRWSMWVDGPG